MFSFIANIFIIFLNYSLVHYPEDRKYTIKPLDVTHLAGRDPVTGRVVSLNVHTKQSRKMQLT